MITLKSHIVALLVTMLLPLSVMAVSGEDRFPFRGEVLPGYDENRVRARCDSTDLQPVEGLWYYPDEMMTVVVERCENLPKTYSSDYRIVLVSANDMSLLPGTVIGYCVRSADSDKFKLWMYSEQRGAILENPQLCVASLSNDGNQLLIERSEVKVRLRVNFSRFLPKLLKGISVTAGMNEVEIPEGFRKIYPKSADSADEIRYL